jgi:hypothetical protein
MAGAVLPLIGLLMVAIVGFAALAVDLSRLSTENSEKLLTADLAAIGSLKAFYNATGAGATPTNVERRDAALQRAREIAGVNFSTALNFAPHVGDAQTLALSIADAVTADLPGHIRFGRWWTTATDWPGDTPPLGCDIPATPCFQDWAPTDTWLASSVAVGLRVRNASPVRNFFARIWGAAASNALTSAGGISASDTGGAVAAMTPRHTVVLFDLGRGTTVDGRLLPERNTPFNLSLEPSPASLANAEPVNSILDSVYEIMTTFNNPTPPAITSGLDQIAWIGFDDSVNRGGFRNGGFVGVGNQALNNFINVLDPTPAIRAQRGSNQLLPLPPSTVQTNNQSGSDLALALQTARIKLEAHPRFEQAYNSVVLLTNGLSGCGPDETGVNIGCPIFYRGGNPPDYTIENRQYIDHNNQVRAGYNEVLGTYVSRGITIDTLFFGRESSPHFVLRRDGSTNSCMSENRMREQGLQAMLAPGMILSPEQWQEQQLNRWLNIGISSPPPGAPVYPRRYSFSAIILYNMSVATRGGWLPVLPPCNVDINCTTGGGAPILTVPSGLDPQFFNNGELYCNLSRLPERDLVRQFVRNTTLAPAIRLVHY